MGKRILPAVTALFFFALSAVLGWLFVASLGTIIPAAAASFGLEEETAETVRRIFSQLNDAEVTPHVLIPAVAAGAFALLRFLLVPKHGFVTFLYVLLGVVLWFGIFFAEILLSRINGIRVLDIITVVTDLIRGGLFETL